MGFYYRKSVSLGPFRVNVGKSSVGLSTGTEGVRTRTLRAKSLERFQATSSGKHPGDVEMHHIGNGTVAGTISLLLQISITARFGFMPRPVKAPDLRVKVNEPWATKRPSLQLASILPASRITSVAFTSIPWIESRYPVATNKRLKRVATHLVRP